MYQKRKRTKGDDGQQPFKYGRYRRQQLAVRRQVIPRGMAIRSHSFKQTFHPSAANVTTDVNCHYSFSGSGPVGSGTLYGPASTDTVPAGYFSIKFTLADLPQVSSFTALFDTYKINKVVVKLIPFGYPTGYINTASNLSAQPQWLSTVIDYDDSTVLTSEGSLLEYETFKQTRPGAEHVRVLVPAISVEAYKTSGTTIGYSQKRKQWLDAAYTDVEHYGIKGLINGPQTMADQIQTGFKVYCTAYVTFKQTR